MLRIPRLFLPLPSRKTLRFSGVAPHFPRSALADGDESYGEAGADEAQPLPPTHGLTPEENSQQNRDRGVLRSNDAHHGEASPRLEGQDEQHDRAGREESDDERPCANCLVLRKDPRPGCAGGDRRDRESDDPLKEDGPAAGILADLAERNEHETEDDSGGDGDQQDRSLVLGGSAFVRRECDGANTQHDADPGDERWTRTRHDDIPNDWDARHDHRRRRRRGS